MPHVHLSLVAHRAIQDLTKEKIEGYVKEVGNAAFLSSPGTLSDNPLSPCALLSAGVISYQLNYLWYGITVTHTIPVPPPNTNILGMFDDDIKGGKIPKDDPNKAAEIMARLFVWHSWRTDAVANTLINGLKQQQCLDLLISSPDIITSKIQEVKPPNLIFTHSPAAAYYSAMLTRDDSEKLFKELRKEGFMNLSIKGSENPFAPSSLLKALRLASRLNELWNSILTGDIKSNDPLLGEFSQDLKTGSVPGANPIKAAQITAQLFGMQILAANAFTDILTAEATQKECLNEIFRPGLIRARLIKEGKFPH
ncbi:hypothetical protein IID10_20180 [candidate division KSB1 bacterium]|nr:hypothetical protein [candidate division KSB1 bacterium]